jgi:hypothetical protein
MSRTKKPLKSKPDNDLTSILSVRVSPADEALLDQITQAHPHARRGAIAREALRRGLAAMSAR